MAILNYEVPDSTENQNTQGRTLKLEMIRHPSFRCRPRERVLWQLGVEVRRRLRRW